ncbi:Zn-dependent protease with chaperone function [Marinobacterium lacunae]|uniref:Zn-dependent protease with chaperone function n=1 Tax=Marinobacterium lacunae TaxID=1232683 RepID=A0A081FZ96_9GAMM|nr:M48 family metallopeptidase [Marinobacterium lacunae]KEA63851.1 Zn-dependent protease with chaperone function [Marinobacterium lacunae]
MPKSMKRILTTALLSLAATGCAVSPTGEKTLLLNSSAQMNSIGSQSFEEMKKQKPIEQDAKTNKYVACIANAIVAQVPREYGYQPSQWELVVFKSDDKNAFALPGAKIGVYTGMIKLAKNHHQLASVIGHEVAHVLAQHSNARLSQQQLTQLGLATTSLILGETVDSTTRQAALNAVGLGAQYGILLPYSRRHESEADQLGQELMAKAGFDPREAAALWQEMSKQGGATPPEFLSTHPAPATRIQQLSAQADTYLPVWREAINNGRHPDCDRFKPY